MEIQRSLAIWEGPGQIQGQFNRRIADVRRRVDPLNAKFVEFSAQCSKEEMLAITRGLAPVDSGCFRLLALVFYQGVLRMTLAGKEHPEITPVQIPISGLLATLTWEYPREGLPGMPK
jgi:hypothetical protein